MSLSHQILVIQSHLRPFSFLKQLCCLPPLPCTAVTHLPLRQKEWYPVDLGIVPFFASWVRPLVVITHLCLPASSLRVPAHSLELGDGWPLKHRLRNGAQKREVRACLHTFQSGLCSAVTHLFSSRFFPEALAGRCWRLRKKWPREWVAFPGSHC